MKQASDFISEGKLLHALQIYEAIINEETGFIDAYIGLAEIYENLGNTNKAIEILTEFLAEEPENRDVRMYLGQFLLRNSKWEEVIDTLSYLDPLEEPLVSFFLGYSNFMLNDFELARINFQNFNDDSEKNELFYEANLYLAKIEIKLSNFREALAYAKKAEVMYNNYWELNALYAEIYYNLDMHAHALAPIEKAIKLNPSEMKLYDLAGRIYFKHGDFYKAEKNFVKLVESSENISSDAYTKLAEACMKGKKIKAALVYFEMALKLDPENKTASEWTRNLSGAINDDLVIDV